MTTSTSLPPPAVASAASLLAAARDDPDAFRELYGRHAEAVHQYFVRRTGSRTAALDLTAERLAQAWLVRARFRDEANGSAAPWIYGIARNLLLTSIRRGALERRATERLGLQEHLDRPRYPDGPAPNGTWASGADELLDPPSARRCVGAYWRTWSTPTSQTRSAPPRQRRGFASIAASPPSAPSHPLQGRQPMTHCDLDPDLARLGDALRTSATIDLAREERAAGSAAASLTPGDGARSPGARRRPRLLAGGTRDWRASPPDPCSR